MSFALRLLQAALYPSSRAFHKALEQPERSQNQLLKRLVSDSAGSLYGQSHSLKSVDDFYSLPIVRYDDLEPWIEKQKQGEAGLSTKKILFYEKTSGSSGAAKYIPYTADLKTSFSRMFACWARDLLKHGPAFKGGKLYFSVSPNFDEQEVTEAGVPVGLEDDSDYLDGLLKGLFNRYFVDTKSFARIKDPEQFKAQVLAALINEKELEVISVWNPSFLSILLKLGPSLDRFKHLIHRAEVLPLLKKDPIPWAEIWPELKLISCWTQGAAHEPAQALGRHFPETFIQGKGLLATEAPLTVPLLSAGKETCLPMLSEVFFEFEDQQGQIFGIAELEEGRDYSLIISQKSGFLRYRMGDRVRVQGQHGNCPALQFLGRDHSVTDLVGEKLNEDYVLQCLSAEPFRELSKSILIPMRGPDRYRLLVETTLSQEALAALAEAFEDALQASYHYRHARRLGQLGPCELLRGRDIEELRARLWMEAGGTWGDMKAKRLQSLDFGRRYQEKAS